MSHIELQLQKERLEDETLKSEVMSFRHFFLCCLSKGYCLCRHSNLSRWSTNKKIYAYVCGLKCDISHSTTKAK